MDKKENILRKRRSASRVRGDKVASAANALAKALTSNTSPLNLDLKASVAGYTHRGGFKLKIENIENLTGGIVDQWREECTALGFLPTVAYDVTTSTATLHAAPNAAPRVVKPKCGNPFEKLTQPHPLTATAVVFVALNIVRHILSY